MKKYRLQMVAQVTLGFSKKRGHRPDGGLITSERKVDNRLAAECKGKVKAFFFEETTSAGWQREESKLSAAAGRNVGDDVLTDQEIYRLKRN